MTFSALPQRHHGVIYADPPWAFKTYSDKGKGKSPDNHYVCQDIDWIKSLPVADLAAPDCALFLWATWPMMREALDTIDAWGFKYSGLAWEWIKQNPETGKFAFGCGYGTRKNLEPCILARRGKPKILSRSERDFMFAPRREHSRKPDEARTRIERMYGGPYLELFARQETPGWSSWGNQVDKFQPLEIAA